MLKYFACLLSIVLILSGCEQPETSTWTNEDQAEHNAYIGFNQQPVLIDDKTYIQDLPFQTSNRSSYITRDELIREGFKGYCQKAYAPQPEPKIINYDTGETEAHVDKPKEQVALECRTVRQPEENPKTYQPLKWWAKTDQAGIAQEGITQEHFNQLTGRGEILHDYSQYFYHEE